MVTRITVDLWGTPHPAGEELDRLMKGPEGPTFMAMEAALLAGYTLSLARAHVITGALKGSVHPDSHNSGAVWEGSILAARDPGIYELARGDHPTHNHPEGGHYFFDPGGPSFERGVRQSMWEYVTDGEGGNAPSDGLGPWSGGG